MNMLILVRPDDESGITFCLSWNFLHRIVYGGDILEQLASAGIRRWILCAFSLSNLPTVNNYVKL